MGDGALSQSEIDALLQGTDSFLDVNSSSPSQGALSDIDLNAFRDVLIPLIDIQSSTLKNFTNREIQILNPKVELVSKEALATLLPMPILEISLPFEDELVGFNAYFYKSSDAIQLGSLMMGQESKELTDMLISAVAEATSQIIGSAITYFSNTYKIHISTGSPAQFEVNSFSNLTLPSDESVVRVTYILKIDKSTTNLYQILSPSIVQVLSSLKQGTKPQVKAASSSGSVEPRAFDMGESRTRAAKSYQPAAFSKLEPVLSEEESRNINLLLDVEMEVTVELGKTQKTIKDILSMGEGTIITLNRLAGETLDVLVNGKPIAKGEAIVIEEYFGVRITEILSKEARISTLK